jgi:MT0933-like antitoxin protein
MGIADRLKDLKTKATGAAAERSDKLHEAVEKATTVADERTGGKYREHIQKAGAKADSLLEGLKGSEGQAQAEGAASSQAPEAAQAPEAPAEAADRTSPAEGEHSTAAP